METRVLRKTLEGLGAELRRPDSLLIYDRLLPRHNAGFANVLKRVPRAYGVNAGESLKDLAGFAAHATRLAALAGDLSPRTLRVYAVGGGSVGDFAGFFASIFKRGVRIIHVPSTWLAAVDSAHGGKTAMNLLGVKNQFGTFHPASEVILVRDLLFSQPEERAREAFGEVIKIAIIDGGPWTRAFDRELGAREELIWKILPDLIDAKMKIVRRDPREESGLRQKLNLGHTTGHVFEVAHRLPHGTAVTHGLRFALDFAFRRKLLTRRRLDRFGLWISEWIGPASMPKRKIGSRKFLRLLRQDKKSAGAGSLSFVFPRDLGRVQILPVTPEEIADEARRQGWVR